MKQLLSVIFVATLLLSVGCSVLDGSSPSQGSLSPGSGSSQPSSSDSKRVEGIEITWEVPGEPVDGFVIRYGQSRGALSNEVKIAAGDLREESDPEYGPVYRYLIKDVSNATPLFVSIAAYKGDRISNFSDVLAEK